jgi:predicted SnoaL-like aldol condensation-catalyzing enzyme
MSHSRRLAIGLALLFTACGGAAAQVVGHPDPLAQLASDDPELAANKQLVFDMWRGIVNAGHVELADELLAEGYIQHSPVLPTGRAAFRVIFSAVPRRDAIPELVEPPLVASLAEGPLVVMALVETLPRPDGEGGYSSTHFNLFRVDNGRLAEHWHSVQTPPGPEVASPANGGPQPVTGRTGSDQYALLEAANPALAANKRLVFDAWRQIVDAGREELTELYFAPDFVSHNPNAAPGRNGFATQFGDGPDRPIEAALRDPLVAVVADGDLVVLVRGHEHPHPVRAGERYTTTGFDMFRIVDGRIVEHWDAGVLATRARCPADGTLGYVCGLSNAEDFVRLGTSRWLVASSITRRGDAVATGRLYLIDAVQKTAAELFPGAAPVLAPDTATFGDCGPIDLTAFDTHGLALRERAPGRYRLYATSHGVLEAIQVFEIDATGPRPTAAWVGCVALPPEVWANSVAILDDGGFVTTQFMDPTDPESIAKILAGEVNGLVYEWHPGGEVEPIEGTELSGPNGIEVSADGRYLYVAAFGGRRVVRYERGVTPMPSVAVDVPVTADNLRWSERGTLLTAGSNAAAGSGWTIYEIDPVAMTAEPVAGFDQTAALQGASVALEVDGELWVGTPGGDRVGYVLRPGADGEQAINGR